MFAGTSRAGLALAATLLTSFAAPAFAQSYPTKPIEINITYGAGGGVDLNFRAFAPFLEKELGQPVVIVNRGGAGGVTGWTFIARAKSDGYSLGNYNLPALSANFATGALPFDPVTQFDFLGQIAFDPVVVAVSGKSPFKNMTDAVDHMRKNPGGLSYAATGIVSSDALTAKSVEVATGVKFRIVNFDSGKEAITAGLGGHVDAVGLTVSEAIPYVKDGSLRVLAVGGDARDPQMPDVPTFKELGYDIQFQGSARGLAIPVGAPPEVLDRLKAAVRKIATSSGYPEKAAELGLKAVYVAPEEVKKTVGSQVEWLKANLKR
ncbi:Bug family tripartite tricarboxylate transporter substrate binding protein [Skermanella stibiiresistens]|uniref:Bug family tripartite tricarboxylate transporter substrate binding protein n=1 Tax=Skermanella stibiiresistens TaxID=913326 RepID=UPI0004B61704|nr:tripartite tricarboxylate transporter substrate binding protein [Skermanella stibiiresistens]